MNAEPTVFLVDDDPAVLDSYSVLLRSMRLRYETFSSGLEFLEQFDPARPGCLVLDVRMPGMSGPEIQERLSRSERSLPIVFVSAFVDMRTAVKMVQLGALDFLQKGGNDMELLATIQKALCLDAHNRQQHKRRREVSMRIDRLTVPESEVLELVLQGIPNKTISGILRVSRRCVEDRRANTMKKLEVDSLPELVRLMCEYERLVELTQNACSARNSLATLP